MSEDLNKKVENENEGEELDNILVLNDEEGNEVEFEFLDLIEYEGEEYVVLLPVDEKETGKHIVMCSNGSIVTCRLRGKRRYICNN